MYDDNAKKEAQERHDAVIARLDQIARIAAPLRKFQWGTGLLVVNPLTDRFWILPQGYAELLDKLDLAEGDAIPIDDAQLGFVTGFLPAALGELGVNGGAGFSDADIAAIKEAIAANRVAVTADQLRTISDTVGEAARTSGEDGAREALKSMTVVVPGA